MKIVESNSKLLVDLINSKKYFRIAGLDVGTKTIGVAISDETRSFSTPLKSRISRGIYNGNQQDIIKVSKQLNRIIHEYQIKAVIIGLPVYYKKLTPFCINIIDLIMACQISSQSLKEHADKQTDEEDTILGAFWDEYKTTKQAKKIISVISNRKSVVWKKKDGIAASIILESYLDHIKSLKYEK
jgi:putative Holliday junction resolvase